MSAPRKKAPARAPELIITPGRSGEPHTVSYRLRHFRIMFSDGRTLDVIAQRDDNYLRTAALELMGGDEDCRVEGVATVAVIDA
jgi:hypothetical protein